MAYTKYGGKPEKFSASKDIDIGEADKSQAHGPKER